MPTGVSVFHTAPRTNTDEISVVLKIFSLKTAWLYINSLFTEAMQRWPSRIISAVFQKALSFGFQ